jgi:hypothetical protein
MTESIDGSSSFKTCLGLPGPYGESTYFCLGRAPSADPEASPLLHDLRVASASEGFTVRKQSVSGVVYQFIFLAQAP